MSAPSLPLAKKSFLDHSSIVGNVVDVCNLDDVRTSEHLTPSLKGDGGGNDSDDDVTPADRILRGMVGSSSDDDSDDAGNRPAPRKLQRSNNDQVMCPFLSF